MWLATMHIAQGISLQKPVRRSDVFIRPEVANFAKSYNDESRINTALKQSRADKLYHDASEAFSEGNMQEALDAFFLAIHSRYDIEKPVTKRLLRRKLNVINQLKEEKAQLIKRMKEREETIRSLAVEYCMMGRECEDEGMKEAPYATTRRL